MDGLGPYLERLGELRRRGASEDTIRDAFLGLLRGAFPRIEQAEPILLEKHVPALRVRGGYADALYGDLIFEFKTKLDQQRRAEGCEELKRYITNQRHPERYLGILTDGEALEVYALRGDGLAGVDQLRLAADCAAEARVWLDCYLFHEKNLKPTADDVALRFGGRSPTFWHSLRMLGELWEQARPEPAAQTKFAEWESLLSIVYGSPVGDERLFLRHTYLALFARLLGFVALERRSPAGEELPGIVTGDAFQRMGFENFVENDFFTWVSETARQRPTEALLHSLATRVTAAYDLTAIHEDLLKELYQELVDPETRHDLGEFYTPDWLAELTLRQAGFPPRKREATGDAALLDPACGSGTFLFTAVRLLRDSGLEGRELLESCTRDLAGVDVHPLAVTIAKTNFLLALGADLRAHRGGMSVPVYMADTLSAADRGATHPEVVVPVDVDQLARRTGKEKPRGLPRAFGLPAALAAEYDGLRAAVDAVLHFASPELDDAQAKSGLATRLEELGVAASQFHQWEANLDLMRWLLAPPATDSVWRFILRNACQPELLAQRKFGFVVGNPPWLAYNRIRRRDYQERVKKMVFGHGLLTRREANLVTQMELATLFFASCVDRYLAARGTIALVMPRSVLTGAKHHAAFRARYVAAARLIVDCERVAPLFNVPACVLISGKAEAAALRPDRDRDRRVRALRLSGQLPSRNASYREARARLQAVMSDYTLRAAAEKSPYWGEVTQGASLAPRCAWFVAPSETARVVHVKCPYLLTDRSAERQAKAPWRGVRLEGKIEADFLFATLLADHMVPFGWRRLSLTALPLVVEEDGRRRLLDFPAAAGRGKIHIANWVRQAEAIWKRHAKRTGRVKDIYGRLDFSGCLTKQQPSGVVKLVYGSAGTHVCSCVVDARNPAALDVHGLPVRGFIADYVTYWLETGRADEAHYLCALLNTPRVDEAIKPFQTKGAFGAQRGGGHRHIHRRPFEVVAIPRFSSKDPRHRELARLSQRCHKKVARLFASPDQRLLDARIGPLRTEVRRELLCEELAAIDKTAADVLGLPP